MTTEMAGYQVGVPVGAASAERLLTVDDLSVDFNTDDGVVHAVRRVSFDLDRREVLGVVGDRKSVV